MGRDALEIEPRYGERLLLQEGINAVSWGRPAAIEAEMRRVILQIKKRGGCMFSSDYSIPSSVSPEDFRRLIALARKRGLYG